jgi:hypothetical protein
LVSVLDRHAAIEPGKPAKIVPVLLEKTANADQSRGVGFEMGELDAKEAAADPEIQEEQREAKQTRLDATAGTDHTGLYNPRL